MDISDCPDPHGLPVVKGALEGLHRLLAELTAVGPGEEAKTIEEVVTRIVMISWHHFQAVWYQQSFDMLCDLHVVSQIRAWPAPFLSFASSSHVCGAGFFFRSWPVVSLVGLKGMASRIRVWCVRL